MTCVAERGRTKSRPAELSGPSNETRSLVSLVIHQTRRTRVADFATLVIAHHGLNTPVASERHRVAQSDPLFAGFGDKSRSERVGGESS